MKAQSFDPEKPGNEDLLAAQVYMRSLADKSGDLLEAAPDAMVIVDQAGKIIWINAHTEKLFGYTRRELLGESMERLVPERFRSRHAVQRNDYLAEPRVRPMGNYLDLYGLRRDGSEFAAEISLSPIQTAEGLLVIAAIRDTTERKQFEQALREKNLALASANAELEAFAYSISHDLRAPLRRIDGFSLALLQDHAGRLDEEGQQLLGRVRAAADRMGALIDDLLRLSRVARAEFNCAPVDLSAVARAIATSLRQVEPERLVELVIADGVTAHGDQRLLRVALENLLGNAWKYTRRRSHARIEFGALADVYFVRDDGAGFDMAYAARLFAPFQRLHTESEFEGTGIGLATVQRIIHRHGGRLWAEGQVDKGATFYFTLRT